MTNGSPSAPDDNFLEVSYSTDGSTWIPIQKVNEANWKDLTITLPLANWSDFADLQVRIAAIPTSLTVLPPVYLDGMLVEVHYDVGPLLVGNDTGSSGSQQQNSFVGPQIPVVVTPSRQLTPSGGQKNFAANQAPTFNFDLNDLPSSSPSSSSGTGSGGGQP